MTTSEPAAGLPLASAWPSLLAAAFDVHHRATPDRVIRDRTVPLRNPPAFDLLSSSTRRRRHRHRRHRRHRPHRPASPPNGPPPTGLHNRAVPRRAAHTGPPAPEPLSGHHRLVHDQAAQLRAACIERPTIERLLSSRLPSSGLPSSGSQVIPRLRSSTPATDATAGSSHRRQLPTSATHLSHPLRRPAPATVATTGSATGSSYPPQPPTPATRSNRRRRHRLQRPTSPTHRPSGCGPDDQPPHRHRTREDHSSSIDNR